MVGDGGGAPGPLSVHLIPNSALSEERQRPACVCEGGLLGGGGCAHTYTHIKTPTLSPRF